jgi:hypothetical protein
MPSLPMGLAINKDLESERQRASDKRGYIDADIPILSSFGILVAKDPMAGVMVLLIYMLHQKTLLYHQMIIEHLLIG